MDFGVFIPIGNNGWLISENSPAVHADFELNKRVVQEAEAQGFAFALSMIKLRGFGGKTEFWDHNLESFTLMAGLAAVTERIKLYASTAVLTLPPALVARMASTIDSIAPGRFGVNIVSGWAKGEYEQMGLWPGDEYFGYRYDYATEYVQVLRDLWETGRCDLDGQLFRMDDCVLSPRPPGRSTSSARGSPSAGCGSAPSYGDYNFILSPGVNDPEAYREPTARLAAGRRGDRPRRQVAAAVHGDHGRRPTRRPRRSGSPTTPAPTPRPSATWPGRAATTPPPTPRAPRRRSTCPRARSTSTWPPSSAPTRPSPASSTQVAAMPGVKGMMFTFDDFEKGVHDFGTRVKPLLGSLRRREDSGARTRAVSASTDAGAAASWWAPAGAAASALPCRGLPCTSSASATTVWPASQDSPMLVRPQNGATIQDIPITMIAMAAGTPRSTRIRRCTRAAAAPRPSPSSAGRTAPRASARRCRSRSSARRTRRGSGTRRA